MKAVVKYGVRDGNVELRDVPMPSIGPSDVLLEVRELFPDKRIHVGGDEAERRDERCAEVYEIQV